MKKNGNIFSLFLTFLKIGAFTFGGGYAMIAVVQREVAEKKHWVTDEEILDMIAISESTPGPYAINSATFVGYRVAGFWGAAAATLGTVLPSLIVITAISYFLNQFESYKIVKYAFTGIRAGVAALVIKALINMSKQCPKNMVSYILVALAFVAVTFFDISAILIIACGGVFGLIFYLFFNKEGEIK
jgi:chromate transporter